MKSNISAVIIIIIIIIILSHETCSIYSSIPIEKINNNERNEKHLQVI